MPIYFSEIAPTCPISRDQPVDTSIRPFIRKSIPPARDLQSAIITANIARNIVSAIVNNQVRNNVYGPPFTSSVSPAKDKHQTKRARWVEQKDKRIKRNYKYYAKDSRGKQDKDVWLITERIERMVWHDSGWNSYMTWEYGNKGEGEPVGGPGGGGE